MRRLVRGGALVSHPGLDGIGLEVHPEGIQTHEDHMGNPIVLVHVRVDGSAGLVLHWRPDLGAWARDKSDRLADLPDAFVAELEALLDDE